MTKSRVIGVGHFVPKNVITNQKLSEWMDTSDEWIVERTGIQERRFITEGVDTTCSMALAASNMALERAGLHAEELDMIIFATLSPDYNFPGSAVLLQRELGLNNIPALDIRQQCANMVYGFSIADQYIKSGMMKNILLVGVDVHSHMLEFSNRGRNTAVLFGDGAGAFVLQANNGEEGVLSTHIHADGSYAEELMLEHPSVSRTNFTPEVLTDGSMLPFMNGQAVFKQAVQRFPETILEAFEASNKDISELDLLIPHQANLRISQYVQKKLQLRDDQVFNNIMKYGNTTSASIPIACSEAWEQGLIKEGDLVCFAAFGSGFVWGSVLLTW